MTTYIFDGTKKGLLTCIFESYYKKEIPERITDKDIQTSFTDETVIITSDDEKAERVYKCLKECKTKYIVSDINVALKSGDDNKFDVIFAYLKKVIDNKKCDISEAYSLPEVLAFSDLKARIYTEFHRFKGFLRFMETSEGYFYAVFQPDNDIAEMLVPHFKARFKSPFVIHDLKRNRITLCNGYEYKSIDGKASGTTVYLSDNERDFRDLWRAYYKSVNVKERKNTRLMRAFMPERYWDNLTEKQENIGDF